MSRERALVAHLSRRSARAAAPWAVAVTAVVWTSALTYAAAYPTAADRSHLAATLGGNEALAALFGPPVGLDSVLGFTAWRSLGLLTIVAGIWGVLTGSRCRSDEDSGRWELVLAAPIDRRAAAAAQLVGLAAGLAVWVAGAAAGVTLAATVTDIPTRAATLLVVALASPAALFLAVGGLAAQVLPSRRDAASAAGAAFLVAYLLRVAGRASGHVLLADLSPVGWVDRVRPTHDPSAGWLVPALLVTLGAGLGTIVLAGRRDLGTGAVVVPVRRRPGHPERGPKGPLGLAGLEWRAVAPTGVGWAVGLAATCLLFATLSGSLSDAATGRGSINDLTSRLGVNGTGAAAFLGLAMLPVTSALGLAAAAFVVGLRTTETGGRLDTLLALPVSRRRWFAGRVAGALLAVTGLGLTAGVALAVAAPDGPRLDAGRLLLAGLNAVPAAWFVVGVGAFAAGFVPTLVAALSYGAVAWSFLVEFVGSLADAPRWLLDLSLLHHVRMAPAVDPAWSTAAVLAVAGLGGCVAGLLGFVRRDLSDRP